jgi:hypothetical protein
MRRVLHAIAAVIMTGAALGAVIPAASAAKDPLNQHAGQLSSAATAVPGVTSNSVPVSGHICGGHIGGGCWWETAVQFWYDMKHGRHVRADLASVYREYHGKFEDGWTDDNAWWGITWQLAYQSYGVSKYHALALSLWKWDTTKGWDKACGGSTLQHPGGTENDISRAALGVLSSSLGRSGSASRAAAWIFKYMQGSRRNRPAAEGLKRGTCTAYGTAQLGGQTESWKIEQLTGGSGQPGTKAKAKREYPDSGYKGVFNLLYRQYIG